MTDFGAVVKYRYGQILIQTERVLESAFHNQTVSLTGAQLELLRNVTAYLHNPAQFVSSYGEIAYTTPSESEWDELQAIVADLESKLMGNDNVVLGIFAPWSTLVSESASAGVNVLETAGVPEGYLYIVTNVNTYNQTRACSMIQGLFNGSYDVRLAEQDNVPVGQFLKSPPLWSVMREDDIIRGIYVNCQSGDIIGLIATGFIMKI